MQTTDRKTVDYVTYWWRGFAEFIKELQIHNYKAIKDMQFHFSPGVNLLIGDNGVGKTSVLDALSVALGGFLAGVKGVS